MVFYPVDPMYKIKSPNSFVSKSLVCQCVCTVYTYQYKAASCLIVTLSTSKIWHGNIESCPTSTNQIDLNIIAFKVGYDIFKFRVIEAVQMLTIGIGHWHRPTYTINEIYYILPLNLTARIAPCLQSITFTTWYRGVGNPSDIFGL